MANNIHIATKEEKEKFLSKLSVEVEDIGQDEKTLFLNSLDNYNTSMEEQIKNLDTIIDANAIIIGMLSGYLKNKNTNPYIKEELEHRLDILNGAKVSKILMTERLMYKDMVKEFMS